MQDSQRDQTMALDLVVQWWEDWGRNKCTEDGRRKHQVIWINLINDMIIYLTNINYYLL
jgi:hypothetical protein